MHARSNQVKGSLNGWSSKKDATISEEIFNIHEDIHQSTCQGNNNTQNTDDLEAEDPTAQEIPVSNQHEAIAHGQDDDDLEGIHDPKGEIFDEPPIEELDYQ